MNAINRRIVGLLFLLIVLLPVVCAQAQAMRDPGISQPHHPSFVHYRVGIYFALRGNYERALDELTQAIDKLPIFGSAYAARGDVYMALSEYDLAIGDYTAAIDIYPDFVSALYTRGRAYHATGEFELAIDDYENAVAQMPEYPMSYWGMGDLLFEQEQYAQALENYQTYLALVDDAAAAEVMARVAELESIAAVDIS